MYVQYIHIYVYTNICYKDDSIENTGHFRCKKSHTRDNNRKCLF